MAATLGIVGCNKEAGADVSVDTTQLQQAFQSAEPALKSGVDTAITAIKNKDYAGALSGLQKTAADAKLTPEQTQAVKDLLAKLQQAVTGAASKVMGEAGKAADDAAKAVTPK